MVAAQIARLEQACADTGRDPGDRSIASCSPARCSIRACRRAQPSPTRCARYAEAGATDVVVHWPRPDDPYHGDAAAFERIVGERS